MATTDPHVGGIPVDDHPPAVIMRCVAMADGRPAASAGLWLRGYWPEGRGGKGKITWTSDPAQAKRFPSAAAAMECYTTVPASQPARPWDGKPNRPLTAWTLLIEPAPGVE